MFDPSRARDIRQARAGNCMLLMMHGEDCVCEDVTLQESVSCASAAAGVADLQPCAACVVGTRLHLPPNTPQIKLRVQLLGPPKPPSPVPEGVEEPMSPAVRSQYRDTGALVDGRVLLPECRCRPSGCGPALCDQAPPNFSCALIPEISIKYSVLQTRGRSRSR